MTKRSTNSGSSRARIDTDILEDFQLVDGDFEDFDDGVSLQSEAEHDPVQGGLAVDSLLSDANGAHSSGLLAPASSAAVRMVDLGRQQPPVRRFNAVLAGNRKPENTMALKYSDPLDSEVLVYDESDVKEGIDLWKFALIGTIVGQKSVFKAMESYVKTYWKLSPEISMTDKGICVFNTASDMQRVLDGGPWAINGSYPLLLRQWTPGMRLDASRLQILPVWIKLPDLDLQFWTSHMLGRIASMIGKPCSVDKLTRDRIRLSYARVMVRLMLVDLYVILCF